MPARCVTDAGRAWQVVVLQDHVRSTVEQGRWLALTNHQRRVVAVDEIPAAYKAIDQVMADAADLVEIRHTLHQIVNVKGD